MIVTADDFGLDVAINEAVECAHRTGILTGASLMVGESAAMDAVARARAMPSLRVGLHLVLADGTPVSPPERIPDLVGADGRFRGDMAAAGFRFFFQPRVRRQLAAEIRAQFAAFAATGLPLSHVDAHKHFHMHPTVLRLAIQIGRELGLRSMRLPFEARAVLARAEPRIRAGAGEMALGLWARLLGRTMRRAGLITNDQCFGIRWSGSMTEERWLALIPNLPPGLSEVYCHPAMRRTEHLVRAMPEYRFTEEFAALTSARVAAALAAAGVERCGFAEAAGTAA